MCIIVKEDKSIGVIKHGMEAGTSVTFGSILQMMKPKLSRKVTNTPKINLNKYWTVLERLAQESSQ